MRDTHAEAREREQTVRTIMTELGLGFDPSWYEGGTCAMSRLIAAKRLPDAIKRRFEDGEDIAPPEPALMRLAEHVARTGEARDTTLVRTYATIRRIIAWHLDNAFAGAVNTDDVRTIQRDADEQVLRDRKALRRANGLPENGDDPS